MSENELITNLSWLAEVETDNLVVNTVVLQVERNQQPKCIISYYTIGSDKYGTINDDESIVFEGYTELEASKKAVTWFLAKSDG